MSKQVETVSQEELVRRYCARQDATPEQVVERLVAIGKARMVSGWMLAECHQLDSSSMGTLTLVPWGPGCTFKEIPTHPFSPKGLASDMAVVVAVAPVGKGN